MSQALTGYGWVLATMALVGWGIIARGRYVEVRRRARRYARRVGR